MILQAGKPALHFKQPYRKRLTNPVYMKAIKLVMTSSLVN